MLLRVSVSSSRNFRNDQLEDISQGSTGSVKSSQGTKTTSVNRLVTNNPTPDMPKEGSRVPNRGLRHRVLAPHKLRDHGLRLTALGQTPGSARRSNTRADLQRIPGTPDPDLLLSPGTALPAGPQQRRPGLAPLRRRGDTHALPFLAGSLRDSQQANIRYLSEWNQWRRTSRKSWKKVLDGGKELLPYLELWRHDIHSIEGICLVMLVSAVSSCFCYG
nr:PREDICTED: uncharacterized protein LOC104149755 [Struthio camelus australis]